jgi:hypothetical protein
MLQELRLQKGTFIGLGSFSMQRAAEEGLQLLDGVIQTLRHFQAATVVYEFHSPERVQQFVVV